MSKVFLDTVGLLAIWDEADQWHAGALSVQRKIENARREVVSTTFVMLECGNAAARRPFRADVAMLCESLESTNRLIHPSDSDWGEAWRLYQQLGPGDASIVDCVSFSVMRRLKISDVFSNDRHFASAGFNTLF